MKSTVFVLFGLALVSCKQEVPNTEARSLPAKARSTTEETERKVNCSRVGFYDESKDEEGKKAILEAKCKQFSNCVWRSAGMANENITYCADKIELTDACMKIGYYDSTRDSDNTKIALKKECEKIPNCVWRSAGMANENITYCMATHATPPPI
jgi:hypothetical protein